jgi:nitrate reductase molybdenum cofactor assembly chaperone NarJ/NarW
MANTFKVLSALLAYPTEELQEAWPELRAVVADEGLLAGRARHALNHLISEIAAGDIYDLQERYVFLFDRTRSLSLQLFEHVHGESRDRGQAMIDLQDLYNRNGLAISATELPDFLPLFLEFLSARPLAEAKDLLGEAAHILATLAERLEKRHSSYAAVFRALIAIAAVDSIAPEADREDDDADPTDLVALDAEWEDAPVTFGPESAPGCKDDLIARLRAAKRPAPGPRNEEGSHA